jgi:hypothetical protein
MAPDEAEQSEIDEAIHATLDALNAKGGMVRILHEAGQPAVFLDGEAIVKEHPDGTRELLGTIANQPDDGDDTQATP